MSLRPFAGLRRLFTLSEFPAIVAMLVLIAGLRVASPYFFAGEIWEVILSFGARVGIVAAGMGLLMLSGEFDLSVYGTAVLTPIVAFVMYDQGYDIWVGAAVGLGAAALVGVLNAAITLKGGIPSLITTLGTGYLIYSVALVVSGETTLSVRGFPLFFSVMGGKFYGIWTDDILWFVLVVFLLQVVVSKMRHGNWSKASGGNPVAAKAIGVNVMKTKAINFVVCAVLAGFSGLLTLTELNAANANTEIGLELEVLVAVVIGGIALFGGSGSIVGTMIGSIIVGMLFIGIDITGVNASWFEGVFGVTLILLGIVNEHVRRAKGRLRR